MPEIDTWYVLEGGEAADPAEIETDKSGKLRHKDGRAVAYSEYGPRSRSVDVEVERTKGRTRVAAVEKPEGDRHVTARVVRPEEPPRTYRTRDMKAE